MKSKSKSLFTIVGTLIIGIIIGVLISSIFVNKRIKNFRKMATPDGFANRLYEIVNPDSLQKERLDKMMVGFRERFNKLHSDMKNQMDTMHAELDKVLTDEQMQVLDEHVFKRRFRSFTHERDKIRRRNKNSKKE